MAEDHHAAASKARDVRVAVVLALAAIVSAALGTRAGLLAGDASGRWQEAVRQDIDTTSFKTVFEVTDYAAARAALDWRRGQAQADALQGQVSLNSVSFQLLDDVRAQKAVQANYGKDPSWNQMLRFGQRKDVYDPRLALHRLDALFAESKRQPDELQGAGDHANHKALLVAIAAAIATVAFLLGALARAMTRDRQIMLAATAAILVGAVVMDIVVEVAV